MYTLQMHRNTRQNIYFSILIKSIIKLVPGILVIIKYGAVQWNLCLAMTIPSLILFQTIKSISVSYFERVHKL